MSDPMDITIGERLNQARTEAGLSQQKLALLMAAEGHSRWSQATVWSVETGARPLRIAEGVTIGRVLGVTLSWLCSAKDGEANVAETLAAARNAIAQIHQITSRFAAVTR